MWSRSGLALLTDTLLEKYPADHEVTIYEAAVIPVCDPVILRVPLRALADSAVSVLSTLYIPPVSAGKTDEAMRAKVFGVEERES
jgi:Protein containing tetrapyrrole methyltransferase domain and MazG-like (predicted pyrophosphatase) domain